MFGSLGGGKEKEWKERNIIMLCYYCCQPSIMPSQHITPKLSRKGRKCCCISPFYKQGTNIIKLTIDSGSFYFSVQTTDAN